MDADTLEQMVTIDNPGVLAKPWTHKNLFKIRRDLHVQEAFCAQNNRDIPVYGETHTDLTPPARGY
jgi:predicted phosphodiesterase